MGINERAGAEGRVREEACWRCGPTVGAARCPCWLRVAYGLLEQRHTFSFGMAVAPTPPRLPCLKAFLHFSLLPWWNDCYAERWVKAVKINLRPMGHFANYVLFVLYLCIANYILARLHKDRVPDVGTGFILQHSETFYWANLEPGTVGRAGEYSRDRVKSLPSRSLEYYNRYKHT